VSVLLGVSQVFSNNLTLAEDNLKNALAQLELQGVEMEVLFLYCFGICIMIM
jgi:purine-nucleoside phosphorylase